MKNYRKLIPLLLVLLFIASGYSLYSDRAATNQEYDGYIKQARQFSKSGIVVDASENYANALAIRDTLALRIEAGAMLVSNEEMEDAVKWGEDIAEAYPNEPGAYEFLLTLFYAGGDYASYFEELEIMNKREVSSAQIDEMTKDVEYSYFFDVEFDEVSLFSGGYCAVANEGIWGYIDEAGRKTVNREYSYAGAFYEDFAPVTDSEEEVYFIDPEGNKKLSFPEAKDAKQLGGLRDNACAVWNGNTYDFLDRDGKLLSGGYENVSAYSGGIAAVLKDGSWKLVDKAGKAVSDKVYENAVLDEIGVAFRFERALMMRDGKCVVIDIEGNEIANTSFDNAKPFNDITYAAVRSGEKWGFIDRDGNEKIKPQYSDARSFSNGLAAVQQNGEWGFINENNEMVIPPTFIDARDFTSAGSAFVFIDGKWKLLKLYKFNFA
jgi:hypothetical protein